MLEVGRVWEGEVFSSCYTYVGVGVCVLGSFEIKGMKALGGGRVRVV